MLMEVFIHSKWRTKIFSVDDIQNRIDETIEKVIEEKWGELETQVLKIQKWKGSVEEDIKRLKEDIVSLVQGFETFEKRALAKLSSYDTNILDVNSEMKALEKVFSKIMPELVSNVSNLRKIADDFKKGVGGKEKKSLTINFLVQMNPGSSHINLYMIPHYHYLSHSWKEYF